MSMEAEALVRAVGRGEAPVSDLSALGIIVAGDPPALSITVPPDVPLVVTLADLSTGLLAEWARGTDLAVWAFVVRELVNVAEENSQAWDLLMNALWSAAFGEDVSEEALSLARSLAS